MIYDALKPYIEIFDNEYMSFIEICTKAKLIDFSCLSQNSEYHKNQDYYIDMQMKN